MYNYLRLNNIQFFYSKGLYKNIKTNKYYIFVKVDDFDKY